MAQNGPKASTQACLPYGIDCDRVAGRDVSWCGANGVMCHINGVRVGGWGECKRGGVEVSSGGSVSWRVDGGVMDKDGVDGGAGGS